MIIYFYFKIFEDKKQFFNSIYSVSFNSQHLSLCALYLSYNERINNSLIKLYYSLRNQGLRLYKAD